VTLKRTVEPELLDELPVDDPRAVRSRRDLQMLNGLMLHASIFHAALTREVKQPPHVVAEIGAGDGTLALKLAKRMHTLWPAVHLILVDQQNLVSNDTLKAFRQLGWFAEVVVADVFEWMASVQNVDVVLANLFLHHFTDERLRELFCLISERTKCLVACETRRDWPSMIVCRYLGLVGCNSVTRHDALASVRAGFIGTELSALWPARSGWESSERAAFISTHLFIARRTNT
jgi:hypothetical protein